MAGQGTSPHPAIDTNRTALRCALRLLARQELGHLGPTDRASALSRSPPVLHRDFLSVLHLATGLALHAVGVYVHAELLLARIQVCSPFYQTRCYYARYQFATESP